ncbi:hypothetical protein FQR65_LT19477 [Abscondita terminalis]|nr:hypothetical protein FQR65_LT19477 [Abscondita terminalis]
MLNHIFVAGSKQSRRRRYPIGTLNWQMTNYLRNWLYALYFSKGGKYLKTSRGQWNNEKTFRTASGSFVIRGVGTDHKLPFCHLKVYRCVLGAVRKRLPSATEDECKKPCLFSWHKQITFKAVKFNQFLLSFASTFTLFNFVRKLAEYA